MSAPPARPSGDLLSDVHHHRERRFLLGFLFVSGLLALWVTRAYLAWAVLGLILAYILIPLADRLERLLGGRRVVASAILLVLVTFVVALPLVLLVWASAGDLMALSGTIGSGGFEATIAAMLGRAVDPATAARWAHIAAEQIEHVVVAAAPALLVELVDATVGIFILGSAVFSVLARRDELYAWVRRVLPLQDEREEDLLTAVGRAVDAVVFGIIVVAILTAAAGGILWWLAGLPNPLFWTFAIFVVSMVPALGPSLVIFPGAAYAYFTGDLTAALLLGVGGSILILVVDVYVRPALIAAKGGLDGTLALIGVMGGVVAMGPVGIFAGPLLLAVFLKVVHLVQETHDGAAPGYANEPRRVVPPVAGPLVAPAAAAPIAAAAADPESMD